MSVLPTSRRHFTLNQRVYECVWYLFEILKIHMICHFGSQSGRPIPKMADPLVGYCSEITMNTICSAPLRVLLDARRIFSL